MLSTKDTYETTIQLPMPVLQERTMTDVERGQWDHLLSEWYDHCDRRHWYSLKDNVPAFLSWLMRTDRFPAAATQASPEGR